MINDDKTDKDSQMDNTDEYYKIDSKNKLSVQSSKLPPRYFGILHKRNNSDKSGTKQNNSQRPTNIIGLKRAHNKYRIIKAAQKIKGSPNSAILRKSMAPLGDSYIIAVNEKFHYEGLYRFSSIEGLAYRAMENGPTSQKKNDIISYGEYKSEENTFVKSTNDFLTMMTDIVVIDSDKFKKPIQKPFFCRDFLNHTY